MPISNVSICTTIFTICCVSVAGGTKPTFGPRVKKKKKSTFYLSRTQTTRITYLCCNNHSANINAYGGKAKLKSPGVRLQPCKKKLLKQQSSEILNSCPCFCPSKYLWLCYRIYEN